MNVLLIGSGGREHALAWKLSASPLLTKLYCAPGNGGIAEVAECVPLPVADHTAVIRFCKDNAIDLVVVGPEAPLVAGLGRRSHDGGDQVLRAEAGGSAARRLQGLHQGSVRASSIFRPRPMAASRMRRAPRRTSAGQKLPIVVKADGLAAGKGVTIAATRAEAEAAIDACFAGAFGKAGSEVVIEEFLEGEEASFFALVDGKHALALATAQDHKRVGDGDTGPNTGGMGAYSPAPVMTAEMTERTMREIIEPTVAAMAAARHAVQGRAVRRPDDHRRRPQAHRVQRALRRSRDAGADDAPEVRSAAGAARRRRRRARSASICAGTTTRR